MLCLGFFFDLAGEGVLGWLKAVLGWLGVFGVHWVGWLRCFWGLVEEGRGSFGLFFFCLYGVIWRLVD